MQINGAAAFAQSKSKFLVCVGGIIKIESNVYL